MASLYFAGVHILCGKNNWWRFFEANGWVSFSAGASVAYTFALIGGIITYTALKQELPKTSHRAPFHFLAGVVCFTLLILSVPYFGQAH
ncbi:MAG: hypothetical protein GQ529_12165 [Methyloprofundus sp.]|nr:hypothetical protein [Methyloprofundus sp.]